MRYSNFYHLMGLRMQAPLVFKVDVLGAHFSSTCQKLMWGLNPLILKKKLQVLSSLPVVDHWAQNGICQDCVPASPTFHVVFLMFAQCEFIIQPGFRIFKRKLFYM